MQEPQELHEFVVDWTLRGEAPFLSAGSTREDESFKDILTYIEYQAEHSFSRYVPALYSKHSPVFADRMVRWLNNVNLTDRDKIALFQLSLRLCYFSFDDFVGLYRSAFVGPVTRWIWDQVGMSLDDPDHGKNVTTERSKHTWYASITDSMILSEFYHANGITGIKQRPSFMTVAEFGDPQRLIDYMKLHDLRRIVLFEDFVGTGLQASSIVEWVVHKLGVPVLFVPMLIGPDGLARYKDFQQKLGGKLAVEPVLELGASIYASLSGGAADPLMEHVKQLAQRIHGQVSGGALPGAPPYTPFGFHLPGDTATGATVSLFSNTPDNSLPLIHHTSTDWSPLFPRISRETA